MHRDQSAFSLELAPVEQLAGTDAVLARYQRYAHARFVRFLDQRSFLLH